MKKGIFSYLAVLLVLFLVPVMVEGQETDFEQMLQRVDTVKNPVYKPVLSFSYGTTTFRGDIHNSYLSPVISNPSFKINASTFIDQQHYLRANFFFQYGQLNGASYSYLDVLNNVNFSTDLYGVGIGVDYDFKPFIKDDAPIRPFVGLGIENISFSAKGDLYDANGNYYYYWSDGTIRSVAESTTGVPSSLLYRDYNFETDLRTMERDLYELGTYSQRSMAIPLEVGAQFRVSNRFFFRLGMVWNYTFTDYLDNAAAEGTHTVGKKGNDSYVYSYMSLHFDLFSDPKTRTVELLYADIELDPIFFDDEDGDFVLDVADHCPGTPFGVEVDTLGCPLDGDMDGIPDYLDQEEDSAPGAWVDDNGVTLSEDALIMRLHRGSAMDRREVKEYFESLKDKFIMVKTEKIPEKYLFLDVNKDGYISYEELLKAVDDYFEYKLEMSLEELKEFNQFFFQQIE